MLKRIFISTLTLGVLFAPVCFAEPYSAPPGWAKKEGGGKRILLRGRSGGSVSLGNSLRPTLPSGPSDVPMRTHLKKRVNCALNATNPGCNGVGGSHTFADADKKGFSGLIVKQADFPILAGPGRGQPNQRPPEFAIRSNRLNSQEVAMGRNWNSDNLGTSHSMNPCNSAFVLKTLWHQLTDDTTATPTSFGKIVFADINFSTVIVTVGGTDVPKKVANGKFEVCTWIGDNEYFFRIELVNAELIERTASGFVTVEGETLLSELNPPDKWKWKLNAKGGPTGTGQFKVLIARENSDDILTDLTHAATVDMTRECIDIFFADPPPIQITTNWINVPNPTSDFQFGYCMGRCNGWIINSD